MSQLELLTLVARTLEGLEVPYMLTGSLASSLQGQPRSTHVVDLVVALSTRHLATLKAAFPEPDYYLQESAMAEAVQSGGMVNLLEVREGDKVDFWMPTDQPFDQSRFDRRYTVTVGEQRLWLSRPEDTILMKLKWALASGGSEKQFMDALRVYEVQCAAVDESYLDYWAVELGVTDLLKRLRREAVPPAALE